MKREPVRMREADEGFRYSWKGRSDGVELVVVVVVLIVSRDAILSVV